MDAPKFDAFLSHNSQDKPAVEEIARRLEAEAELKVWLDKWDSVPGEDAIEELETAIGQSRACVVFLGPSGVGPWHKEEKQAALRKRVTDKSYRVIPVLLPGATKPTGNDLPSFLFGLSWVDFSVNGLQDNGEFHRLACGIKGISPRQTPTPAPTNSKSECPYLGLEAFTEDKSHLFFGRDNFIAAIEQKLHERQFIAVVGPSGSGKSSVVQAGVFPRLSNEWHKLVFQPGDNPFLNLADKFVEARGTRFRHFSERSKAVDSVAQQIRDNRSVANAAAEVLAALPQSSRLLLVADQFEELFTLTPVADRKPFVEALLAAAHLTELRVLATLRADFYGQAISLTPELSQLLQDGVVNHRPLQQTDWEAVILQPAKTAGLQVDPALVTSILKEIEAQPDSLPLLEYALKELWQRREQNHIGLAHYEAIGRFAGAINQRADTVLAELSEEEQKLALRVLTRLVRVSGGEEEGADTRLRLSLSELKAEQRDVLQSFITERLLVTNRHDRTNEETIEVAHEALIRQWEKLREALDGDREFLVWRRRLNVRRSLWEQKGRDDQWLLFGGDYDEARRWLNERETELNFAECEFITWVDRPDFQIERIFAKAPDILLFSDEEIRQRWFSTLVFCGELERAFLLAGEVEKATVRARALISIAEALAKGGLVTEGRAATIEALAAVREIKNNYVRKEALSSIAKALVKMEMVTEALAAAREIEDAELRTGALSSIAEALAKAGLVTEEREVMTEALAAAREIEEEYERASTLDSIAEASVKVGLMTEAREAVTQLLAAARKMEDAYDRADFFSFITEALVKVGLMTEAREAVTEVLAAVREIREIKGKDVYDREGLLGSIAGALANVGMLTEALAAARGIKDVFDRASVLKPIAEALANVGMVTEALAATREIIDDRDREEALSSIAEALVKMGIVTEALADVRNIKDRHDREEALMFIAEASAKAGMVTEALAAARETKDGHSHARTLGSVAKVFAKAGMLTEALAAARERKDEYSHDASVSVSFAEAFAKAGMVTEAFAAAREIKKTDDRARALSCIAEAFAKARLVTEAREGMTEAFAAACEIEETDKRASAMISVAGFWLEQGQATEAESLLKETQSAIGKIYDSDERSSAERKLSVILARLHRYREARRIADLCQHEDRLAAYTAILREYHIERNPSLARLFAEDVAETEEED